MSIFWSAVMTVLSAAGAIFLLAAGFGHVVRHREHRAVLRAHRLLPPVFAPLTTGAEVLIGTAVLLALLAAPAAAAPALLAQAGLYTAFAGYAGVLRVRRPGVPCGCFGSEVVSWAVVARAAVLAAAGAACAALGAASPLCVAAGAVLAMAAHLLRR
ncbi:hypothetical protein H4696_008990 [Amycolatopsis lexingtonensis]|uniref:Methylamine utilisation protein MauE domain-containing protein n=1 Tax=Amycolatopsis lexingtonensis TaxID=218822 RepID=A0ABR9IFE9_9PSEU|nr:MauE/DoxX family redox-associated membrane protein [Amycolatopsis lexingtonensis]MBE1501890.1 hypothetical protein [Amycolatopsis lexingtonensis]